MRLLPVLLAASLFLPVTVFSQNVYESTGLGDALDRSIAVYEVYKPGAHLPDDLTVRDFSGWLSLVEGVVADAGRSEEFAYIFDSVREDLESGLLEFATTPADLRFLRGAGADAVGMSTVPEATVARHGNRRVMGVSGISNKANLDGDTITTHEEVLEAGEILAPKLTTLIRGVLRRL